MLDALPAYAVLLALGLLGAPVARSWWARVWPPEAASDYAGRTGHWTACTVRFLAFALIFLPLTAAVTAPYSLGGQIWDAVRGPVRWWRRLAGRRAGVRPSGSDTWVAGELKENPVTTAPIQAQPPPMPAPSLPVPAPMPPARASSQRPQPPPIPLPPRSMPAPARPPQRQSSPKPARSWIAALPKDEETQ